MRKKILLMLSIFCFMGASLFAQIIEGGAGVIHIDGDPNFDVDLIDVSVNEGNILYDNDAKIAYFFDNGGTAYDPIGAPLVAGTQWVAVDISGLVDPITSIVVDAAGSPELTATTVLGVTTLSFESDATITFDNALNQLTFTDVDGDDVTIDISGASNISAGDPSITIGGTGTVADPFTVELTGANGATAGTVPVTDGSGNLTWTNVVKSATVNADGLIELTFTDNTTTFLDIDNAPSVANKTALDAAADALGAGESGIAVSAPTNTFGMPATTKFGVLFFIKKL